uniref:Transcriptional regulator MntR n=1 Tax=Schlesneria paludicola TaxID=360056 RepID=A0A7C4LNL7_9PLAN
MTSLTVENYLKAALQIGLQQDSPWVTTGQLSASLGVSPGSVTSMLKSLAESGLVDYRPYAGVCLTENGKALALRMLRRHRLIELFLARTLDLTWDQVHEEAEHMEHAVSDFLVDRIDEYLGRPSCDPHGDPIPSANGEMRGDGQDGSPLSSAVVGSRVRVVRVTNQGGEFLRYLAEAGLQLGAEGIVRQNSPELGVVLLEIDGRAIAIGYAAAREVLVKSSDTSFRNPQQAGSP